MKNLYKAFSFSAVLLMLGACSDDNKWQPAPPEAATTGAYFDLLESYDILVLDENDHLLTVNMSRLDSEKAVSVPLKALSCPDGVTYPQTVEFEEGQQQTSFEIDMSKMPLSSTGKLSLQIDPAYSTIYGAGTSVIDLDITVSKGWLLLADNVKLDHTYSGNTYTFPEQTTSMYKLDKVNRFKIDDFMDSGLDLVFSVPQTTSTYSYIVPTTNCVLYKDLYDSDEYNSWYFYDTAKGEYPVWTPAGSSLTIEYLSFDSYAEGSEDDPETWISMAKGTGSISTYIDFANGKSAYHWITLSFKPLFDPFAADTEEGEEAE